MQRELPEYAEESGRKAFLWAVFKMKKDNYRKEHWPNYKRENLSETLKMMEKTEFEEWFKEYEGSK